MSAINKFNYSAPEINKKFKSLSLRDFSDQFSALKDYNTIVDNIMTLTGSYNSKSKTDTPTNKPMTPPSLSTGLTDFPTQKSNIFHDLPSAYDQKNLFYPDTLTPTLNRMGSKGMDFNFMNDPNGLKIPNVINNPMNRQPSFQLFNNMPLIKRQGSFEYFDDSNRKKVKTDEIGLPGLMRGDSSLIKPPEFNTQISTKTNNENDELLYNLPIFSKKSSNVSQDGLEPPSLSRFGSAISFMYDKNWGTLF